MCDSTSQVGDVLTTTYPLASGGTSQPIVTTKLRGETQALFEARHQSRTNREKLQNPPGPCPLGGN